MKDEIFVMMDPISRRRGVMSMRGIDCRYVMRRTVAFSRLPAREGVIWILATGVRRDARKIHPSGRGISPTALCGRGAETSSDDLPVVAVDAGSRQVQHDAPQRGFDPGTELHEVFAQGADLGRTEGGARGPQSQLLVEHVGGGGE